MFERHEVAVLALPDVVAFELGLPHRLIGSAVDDAGRPLYGVLPEHDASILRTADTVIIPGIYSGSATERGVLEPELAAALDGLSARMVSICTGAFVLAAAGLLDGRPATTHWMHADAFQSLFPQVRLDPDVLFVDDGDVLTSAGHRPGKPGSAGERAGGGAPPPPPPPPTAPAGRGGAPPPPRLPRRARPVPQPLAHPAAGGPGAPA